MAAYHLRIVTPDREVFSGEAEKAIFRTIAGDVCILANHIDFASALGMGEARITDAEGNTRTAACQGGLLSVRAGEARVMATTFEWADEIDVERAKRAEETARKRMENLSREDAEFADADAKLRRALMRQMIGG